MLAYRLTGRDVARMRLAYSPISELICALRMLQQPNPPALHWPWLVEARSVLTDADRTFIAALVPAVGYMPDFLTPAPQTREPTIAGELAALARTPPAIIEAEITMCHPTGVPAVLRELVDDPERARAELVDRLGALWQRLLRRYWAYLRATLERDIAHHAREGVGTGAGGMLAGLASGISWSGDGLVVATPSISGEVDLDGRGVVFVPTVFAWHWPFCVIYADWQPSILYQPRGIARLWGQPLERTTPERALGALLGATRARLLMALATTPTPTQLAGTVGVDPGGVSRHLSVLTDAGLAYRHRHGRRITYQLTELGRSLVDSAADGCAVELPEVG